MKVLILFSLLFALASCANLLKVVAPIENQYIVVFHQNTTKDLFSLHMNFLTADKSLELLHTYETAIKGYAIKTNSSYMLQKLMSDPIVDYVEQDQMMYATACNIQSNAPSWGLSRVSSATSAYPNTYSYTTNAGNGVEAYIIDTGILVTHNDFGGRASFSFKAETSWSDTDRNGHGTHVASTVGGTSYGIAKQVKLFAVKVLSDSGSGSNAGVIAGINHVATKAGNQKKVVANMSLGGGFSSALNQAVDTSVAKGVVIAVAAGNDNADAKNYSPASASSAISVGSTASSTSGSTRVDTRSTFSNYGSTVHVFAPGTSITGAWYTSNTATNTISGTSMASPHVCGVTALILSDNGYLPPNEVRAKIINQAKTGLINMGCGSSSACNASPNRILYATC